MFLAQQLTEHIENDAIGDAKEEMEWCWNDAIRGDGEERGMSAIDGMLVCWSAITSCFGETVVSDDADRTGMAEGAMRPSRPLMNGQSPLRKAYQAREYAKGGSVSTSQSMTGRSRLEDLISINDSMLLWHCFELY